MGSQNYGGVYFQRCSQKNNQLTSGRVLVGVIDTSLYMTEITSMYMTETINMIFSMVKFILICPTKMVRKTKKVDSHNELNNITKILRGLQNACAEAGSLLM
jgi:hypothetical protein